MNLDSKVEIIGLGVAFALPAAAAIWRTATLRGDTFDKLANRVDIAHTGLSELALDRLRDVQEKTDEHLGEADGAFDPEFVVADPGEIVGLTRQFEGAIKVRDRLRDRFRALLFVCKWAWIPAVIYLVGVAGATYLFASDEKSHLWRTVAFSVASLGALLGSVVVVVYHYLNSRITSAEILGRPTRLAND